MMLKDYLIIRLSFILTRIGILTLWFNDAKRLPYIWMERKDRRFNSVKKYHIFKLILRFWYYGLMIRKERKWVAVS